MRKIILFTALLWAFVGASAQSTNFANFANVFYATGGQKCVMHTTQWAGVKDTTYTITIGLWFGGAFTPIRSYTRVGNDTVQNITDTITDAASIAGIPIANNLCVKAKIVAVGIVDSLSNQVCGINVIDSIVKPKISFLGSPVLDSMGTITAIVKVTSNGQTIIKWASAFDSVKVYNKQNIALDSSVLPGSPTPFNVSIIIARNIPAGTRIYCRVTVKNFAGVDSTIIIRSDLFIPKQAPAVEVDSILQKTPTTIKVRLSVVGFWLSTDVWIKYRQQGFATWLNTDSVKVSGYSIQYVTLTLIGLEPDKPYELVAYAKNDMGTSNPSLMQIQWTVKNPDPGSFGIVINKVTAGLHMDMVINFTVTNTTGIKSSVWPAICEDPSFNPSDMLKTFDITNTVETREENFVLSSSKKPGKYYVRMQGMNLAGKTVVSNVLEVVVRNWTLGIDPNGQFVNSDVDGAIFNLYDISGSLVKSEVTRANENINLSQVKKGTYIYTISMDSKIKTGKIMKF